MSLELLPTLEKDVVSKKKTITESTTESKKEGSSLFDSLLKDATKDKPQTSLKQESDPKQTLQYGKKTISKDSEKLEDKETPVKKMLNSLVDMVVDESKKELKADKELDPKSLKEAKAETKELKSESKETKLETKAEAKDIKLVEKKEVKSEPKEIKLAETKENSGEKIKQVVHEKAELIKEVAKEISKEIKVDSLIKEEVNSVVKLNNKVQDIMEKVEQKVSVIKEKTSKIKEEIQVVVKKESIKDELEATEKGLKKESPDLKINNEKIVKIVEEKIDNIEKTTKDITKEVEKSVSKTLKVESKADDIEIKEIKKSIEQELPAKIEQKVEIIKENAGEIQKEIQKVVVTSDELVKKIQEFKSESKVVISSETSKMQGKTNVEVDGKTSDKNSILSNGFLTSQKQEKQQVSLANLHNAKSNIEEKKTVGAVKESAKILELNPEEVEIEKVGKDGESKSELFTKHEKRVQEQVLQNRSLNKMVIEGQKNSEIINEEIQKKIIESKAVQEETNNNIKNKETVLNLNVPQAVVETIQSKIIGAHQRVGSFMSEVARNMYLNYKPPFTSFKMSLNPANLGTISIIMRANNKDSNLNVSMQMSNNATLDSFVENKAALQNALQRQLGENANISLNFGMESNGNSENFNDTMNNSNGQNSSENSSKQEEENLINNTIEQEQTEKLDYM